MKRMLLIVDPQVDFISGTLPVPGAREAMDGLARYIADSDGRYACKVVTADRHPFDHCSFADCGGKWPRHCVHDTVGAAVWQPLFAPLYLTAGQVTFLYKGQEADREEYSIFGNQEAAARIIGIVRENAVDIIDICGIAGDICVSETLIDGIALLGPEKFNILTPYSPSLDSGTRLTSLISQLSR